MWHFGHITWEMAGAIGLRKADEGGAAAGGAPACCGFPQRAQVGTDVGFMLPQEGQRM